MRMDEGERLIEQLYAANLPLRYKHSNIEMSGERSGEEWRAMADDTGRDLLAVALNVYRMCFRACNNTWGTPSAFCEGVSAANAFIV
jgi:hypothetical protein